MYFLDQLNNSLNGHTSKNLPQTNKKEKENFPAGSDFWNSLKIETYF